MNCGPLGTTGLDGIPLLVAAILAVCLIVVGVILVRSRRRERAAGGVVAVTLLIVATLCAGTLSASPAVAADCPTSTSTPTPTPTDAMTINQTSVVFGLAPDVAPVSINGIVTNNTDQEIFVTDVVVSIVGVTLSPGAAPGTCTAADYVLINPQMPVNQMLAAFGTLAFSGASIGFVNQPWNQDACQNATVELLYVTT